LTPVVNTTFPIDAFLAERIPDISIPIDAPRPSILLPGSFNPLHAAHVKLAEVASAQLGQPTAFELSVVNVDKPPLSREEIERRLHQFAGRATLWLTRAPTFLQKARLFPGVVFTVGADTVERILSPRYYRDITLDAALNEIRSHGCRFLVAGRVGARGHFLCLDDLTAPARHRDLFTAIPAEVFRMDLSSTLLRERLAASPASEK